jgi:CRP-like cAMP-binding protein
VTQTAPGDSGGSPIYGNLILASLPKSELALLAPRLTPVKLPQGQTLLDAGQTVEFAYFLDGGLASVVATMESGTSVEVGVVGKEGVIGLPVLLGTESLPNRTFIQIPASGFRIKAGHLQEAFERPGKLRQRLQRYLQVHLVQASQTAACNRLHEIAERLSRWLLMCQDRTESNDLQITHQSLADMLGTPRSTVTLAARMLQKAGLVDYSRGHIKIQNRKGLEDAACECYRTIRNECDRLHIFL